MSMIVSVEDARVPAKVPNASRGKITRKIKAVHHLDGTKTFGCADCTYTARSFNSVAAHRKVHLVKDPTLGFAIPKPTEKSIVGTHIEKILMAEISSAVDKVTFADKAKVHRLEAEVKKIKTSLGKALEDRDTLRKENRALQRKLERARKAVV